MSVLGLELGQVQDDYARRALEQIAMRFATVAQLGKGGNGVKQPISRAYDFGAARLMAVGSYAELTSNLRLTINATAGNYVRLFLTGQAEHSQGGVNYYATHVYDLTAGFILPSACTYMVKRTYYAGQNETFLFETLLPVGNSGAAGYILPGPRTLTVYASTGVANCNARNDQVPMLFTAQEIVQ